MELTPSQIATFRTHLARVGGRETCPVCDRDAWEYAADRYTIHRQCNGCGLNQTFNAQRCFLVTPWEQLVDRIARDLSDTSDRSQGAVPTMDGLRNNAEVLAGLYHSFEAYKRAAEAPFAVFAPMPHMPIYTATNINELEHTLSGR